MKYKITLHTPVGKFESEHSGEGTANIQEWIMNDINTTLRLHNIHFPYTVWSQSVIIIEEIK